MREERGGPAGDSYRERTRRRLRDIVEDAAGESPLFTPLVMAEQGPNAEARLCVRWRCHPRLPDPDDCERAILQLLYLSSRRVRHDHLIHRLCEYYSESTLERRLKKLVRLGLITRRRRPPRGYQLGGWLRTQADLAEPA